MLVLNLSKDELKNLARQPNRQDYLLSPLAYPHLMDMSPMEKTFIDANKAFWYKAALANVYSYIEGWHRQQDQENIIATQHGPAVSHQLWCLTEYKAQRTTAYKAFKIAKQRARVGYGLMMTNCPKRQVMISFFQQLLRYDRSEQTGLVVNDCLNILRDRVYFEDRISAPNNNQSFTNRHIANINAEHIDLMSLICTTGKITEELELLPARYPNLPPFHWSDYQPQKFHDR